MITAIDPGKTTGVAMWEEDGTGFYQYDNWLQVPSSMWVRHADILIVEKFTITPSTAKKSPQYDALYLIGALLYKYLDKVRFQKPSEAKSFSTDPKLKRVGFWTPGQGHANDAARHLLLYLVKNRVIDPKEVMDASV